MNQTESELQTLSHYLVEMNVCPAASKLLLVGGPNEMTKFTLPPKTHPNAAIIYEECRTSVRHTALIKYLYI